MPWMDQVVGLSALAGQKGTPVIGFDSICGRDVPTGYLYYRKQNSPGSVLLPNVGNGSTAEAWIWQTGNCTASSVCKAVNTQG
jgi:hypothetical protein